ncbi:MAG: MBL fold metallo-hydrolase [Betaproteobacteria bacterium RIFCSPLOWO2_12_FULL_62_58]|nr:MAG: MBL fold metallo-hydrolase [Betaproteobacteria bacterium RIFCSPLOWO2_12_FULL_62_58]
MAKWQYTRGLHDLGNGCYAWLQPDGSWGYSNSGLIVDQGETLLVDTLMDLKHTREMLDGYRAAVPAASRIGTLVNTHSNGDHTYGNQLVSGARIIASRACAEEMAQRRPEERAAMMRNWRQHGAAGAAWHELYDGRFDFEGIVYTPPTEVFDRELTLHVGAKEVRLTNVGPAHTRGDVLAYVPGDRTVFTGDILFIGGHPAVWAGPVSNWIKACDMILGWDVETIVPGHGPITDKQGVLALKGYFEYVTAATRKRFDASMSADEAARDIPLDAYRDWIDDERIVVNVHALYREFAGGGAKPNAMDMHARMARYRKERGGGRSVWK